MKKMLSGLGLGFDSSTVKDREISGLSFDSRKVKSGDLFFAVPGFRLDGSVFIQEAEKRGASAFVLQEGTIISDSIKDRCVFVHDVRRAMAEVADIFYETPGNSMKIIAVTGTKGKTSTAYLIESILKSAGKKTAIMGTVECRHPGKSYPSTHTTREAIDVQSFLYEAKQFKVDYCVMEVSAHALSLLRVWKVPFTAAVFTNLSPDHLDFYKEMEKYFQAKRELFFAPYADKNMISVVNEDDEYGQRLSNELKKAGRNICTFGGVNADVELQNIHTEDLGSIFDIRLKRELASKVETTLAGVYNQKNSLAAAATGFALGFSAKEIEVGICSLKAVPGRLERVETSLPFSVFVDFAHMGHALKNVLNTLRPICKKRLILVFGAGGDKDPDRRNQLGKLAATMVDYSFITSDNPRSEDPQKIIDAIVAAYQKEKGSLKDAQVVSDRREAIRLAIYMAKEGDIVLLAGKGHETGQIVGEQIFPFDDREVAKEFLQKIEKEGVDTNSKN
ncbi:MAG: UDP-N-acetylmuramoyl-L-alanyl-D-glutamate--2,6-diaminopimelate ligase [Oligoflexia bacterium]|nr:UDP-N-acetylmuramoyl-L-alanyl-D-glutamate--2,6-diaminopimelate ligase [Oligoflexia bacterium]